MQKLITVHHSSSTDVDDLNKYLDEGWKVINSYPFSQGNHFLIQTPG